MGSALSCIYDPSVAGDALQPARPPAPPAMVIAADGSLKELLPGTQLPSVSDVLGIGAADGASPSFFMCNSDALYFDEPPPALANTERLRPGQMYFVLPAAMLGRPLSSADIAALAARAIAALPAEEPPRRRRRGRVVAVLSRDDGEGVVDENESVFHDETLNEKTLGEFAAGTSQARGGDKATAAATTKAGPSSALKRALSMIREDAE